MAFHCACVRTLPSIQVALPRPALLPSGIYLVLLLFLKGHFPFETLQTSSSAYFHANLGQTACSQPMGMEIARARQVGKRECKSKRKERQTEGNGVVGWLRLYMGVGDHTPSRATAGWTPTG